MKKITRSIYAIVSLFVLGTVSAFAQPTTSAPTPTAPADNVISIFSNAYTNVAGTNFNPNWGQTTAYSTIAVGTSDNVIKYSNLTYQGMELGSTQDVSNMKFLHIDVWSNDANAATFPITLIWGAEIAVKKTIATDGTWTSLDIPLTEFTGAILSTVTQFKFESNEWFTLQAAGSAAKYSTIYLDNIYFWSDVAPAITVSASTLNIDQPENSSKNFDITSEGSWTVSSNQIWLTPSIESGSGNTNVTITATANSTYSPRKATVTIIGGTTTKTIAVTQTSLLPTAAPTPAVAATNVKSIYSDTYTPAVTVTAFDNWWNMNFSDCTFATGNHGKIITTTAAGNCGSPTFVATALNASSMTKVHIDVFPISDINIGLKLVTVTHGESTDWVSLGTLIPNQWNSIDLPLSSFVISAMTDIKQVGFVTTASFGTFYMDNLYFYTGTTAVKGINADKFVSIFPTTVTDKLNVKSEKSISEVIVRNLVGQTLQTITVNGFEKSINLSNLSSGNYFVSVKLSNGQLSTQKIVKL